MKKRIVFILAAAWLCLLAAAVWGQSATLQPSPPPITPTPTCVSAYTIDGYVLDRDTGKPVIYATVRANAYKTLTDASGYYRLEQVVTPCTPLMVEVTASGYGSQYKKTASTPLVLSINFELQADGSLKVIIPGDVNSDKKVNIIDAMLVAQYSVNTAVAGFEIHAADVVVTQPNTSGDPSKIGDINILDALLIARYSAGLVPNLISLWPQSGQPGDQIVITGTGFDPTNNEVRFTLPDGTVPYFSRTIVSSPDGMRITYRIPSILVPACYYDPTPCPAVDKYVLGGIYQITVTTSKGVSFSHPFAVNPY